MDDFLKLKTAQGVSELTLRDYNNTFKRFMRISGNEIKMDILKKELLEFLTLSSDASPAKFNRPYSNLNVLFNWLVQQNIMERNPLLSIGLKKKRGDERIHCVEVDNIKVLLNIIDMKTDSGLRDYNLIPLMLDCGIRPCEAFRIELTTLILKADYSPLEKKMQRQEQKGYFHCQRLFLT